MMHTNCTYSDAIKKAHLEEREKSLPRLSTIQINVKRFVMKIYFIPKQNCSSRFKCQDGCTPSMSLYTAVQEHFCSDQDIQERY